MVTQLQALRRGAVQARQFRRIRASAIVVQAAWRCATARRAFLCSRAATVCIQAAWRGLMARRAYQAARVGSAPLPQHVMTAGHVHDILRRVTGRGRREGRFDSCKWMSVEAAGLLTDVLLSICRGKRLPLSCKPHGVRLQCALS